MPTLSVVGLLGTTPDLPRRRPELAGQGNVGVRELPLDVIPDGRRPTAVADEVPERVPQVVVDADAADVLPVGGHKRRVRPIFALWQQVTPQLRMVACRGCSVSGLIHDQSVATFVATAPDRVEQG
jgi:hypothetical protein